MSNFNTKRNMTTVAAIGAASVFAILSFGNGAQAAKNSSDCYLLSKYGLTCCDHMSGSRLINMNTSCQDVRRIVHKRRLLPPTVVLVREPVFFGIEKDKGGDNGGGGRGKVSKDPNSLR